ncbi:MAG: saccharopine dehydrogenase NADP-binding domain-containing protein [Candidatus Heimdallarchaeota archaeon]|nr:saccharopine dehydrogenase NADP-binding domain-containing protein [Candidatus Heimdallarchaeota archaeon]MBY8994496.1 saccharopine dehydrogenase NADP-binding domain-containing protein [Candidatus Heimdallarchaeota archaeon]
MKVLLLGVGLQGNAALYDLVQSKDVSEIIAADIDVKRLKQIVESKGYSNVSCEYLDANSQANIDQLMNQKPDVILDLLPVTFRDKIAQSAVDHGLNLVNSVYTSPFMKNLDEKAKEKEITILPEFGFDPGIDLVMLGEARKGLEKIELINSYGSGIPEALAFDNPLKYKVTWTFEGVLRSYFRKGLIIKNGKVEEIKENEMFNPKNIHEIVVKGIGKLEAFPNGDAIKYLEHIGIQENSEEYKMIKEMGRYTMRWPGHSSLWKTLVDLHFLDDEPIIIDDKEINRRAFIAKIIEPHIKLKPHERDLAILRVELIGLKEGKKTRVIYEMVDKRDLRTGFTAMSRTVGFTASIGAQLIGSGRINKKGLLSPVNDIPYEILNEELKKRNIKLNTSTEIITS